jgi:hypothetical protein
MKFFPYLIDQDAKRLAKKCVFAKKVAFFNPFLPPKLLTKKDVNLGNFLGTPNDFFCAGSG